MKAAGEKYSNGQNVTEQAGNTLTYFFENGEIKAQGKYVDGVMQDKWIFNKKEGYLWQVGHFDDQGQQHGSWIRYNANGTVADEKQFEHGKRIKS